MQIINNIRLLKHSIKVAVLSCALAYKLKMSINQCKNLFIAGLFHDIGKIKLDQSILNKKENLTSEEFEHIKQHVVLGVELLRKYKIPERIIVIIEQHHEREDGTGYPNGLEKSEICIEAKILRSADVFDALTSNRAYRRKYTKRQAKEIMRKEELI
ncbi:HD domain-containing protein [Sedimentibacter sp. MB35-C1]|uniref:HD-GYP domain-containing protein n=1 Tax=Sedimentibacter sp. MB35-C1 TaxID=3070995 RepID=UPI0027E128DF|nr:HD domain-containing phosphohydrolase [Sedimentibacter sp. MB35-C1]WMJ77866.1 HD domain-containing protein [Sedimentibacter sp. MB35-C1]